MSFSGPFSDEHKAKISENLRIVINRKHYGDVECPNCQFLIRLH